MSFLGGIIGGVGSIIGGITSANAAKSAANTQANAITQATNFQQGVFNTGQANLNPFISGGQQALSSLLGFYGLPGGNASGATQGFQQFTNSPFYQFPLQQSQLALNRSLASSGLIGSGAQTRDAIQLAQGYASQGLTNYLSGLSGIAGSGQSAATSLLQGGNQAAGTLLQGQTGIGNASAAGTVGSNNALQQGIGNGLTGLTNGLFGAPNTSASGYQGGAAPGTSGLIGNNGLIGSLINSFGGGGGAATGGGIGSGYVDTGSFSL